MQVIETQLYTGAYTGDQPGEGVRCWRFDGAALQETGKYGGLRNPSYVLPSVQNACMQWRNCQTGQGPPVSLWMETADFPFCGRKRSLGLGCATLQSQGIACMSPGTPEGR